MRNVSSFRIYPLYIGIFNIITIEVYVLNLARFNFFEHIKETALVKFTDFFYRSKFVSMKKKHNRL